MMGGTALALFLLLATPPADPTRRGDWQAPSREAEEMTGAGAPYLLEDVVARWRKAAEAAECRWTSDTTVW